MSATPATPRDGTDPADGSQILVVEDERDIAALVAYHLAREGFRVRTVAAGGAALKAIRHERPDLVVLDLMLPELSGYAVLDELRRRPETADVPVVILTARREEQDRIKGLELGADDYLTKPFSPQELVLRIGAVLRRAHAPAIKGAGTVLVGGPVTVDVASKRAAVGGHTVDVTPTELRLLVALLEGRGRVLTRRELLRAAWGVQVEIATRTVDMHVRRLRAKLGDAGRLIETVRGFGYRFMDEDDG